MKMRLKNRYFILRHGETVWPEARSYPWPDSRLAGLNKEGKRRIRAVSRRLKKEKIDKICSSPLYRAKQTAEIVSKTLELRVNFDKRLSDIYLGDYHGKPKTEFYRDFPDPGKRFRSGPKTGENWNEVKKRVKEFLLETEKKSEGKTILIVSHGDPLWFLEGIVKGLTNEELSAPIFLKKEYLKKGELRRLY